MAADEQAVAKDKATLSKAAVANYISDGTASAQNPIFSGQRADTRCDRPSTTRSPRATSPWPSTTCTRPSNSLNAQESQLQGEQSQAQAQVTAEQNAVAQNAQAIQSQKSALAQEQGQIATLVQQQQQAEAAAAAKAAQAEAARQPPLLQPPRRLLRHPLRDGSAPAVAAGLSQAAPPPTAAGGAGALQAAESQIGVPYVWGGESPKGSASPGFDCSGLTAWSWGQAGVGLPHYSGAQMADSTPVPVSDLQPGDLLFYGPGGSEHVAMYVGGGLHDRGALHGGVGLDHRPPTRWRLRGRRPAVAGSAPSVAFRLLQRSPR